jgi:hypothetical protein
MVTAIAVLLTLTPTLGVSTSFSSNLPERLGSDYTVSEGISTGFSSVFCKEIPVLIP